VSSRRPNRRIALAGPEIVLHAAATTLPDPPTAGASVASWNGQDGSVEDFELTITASAATSLTNAVLHSIEAGIAIAMGVLNGGTAIALTATKGFRARIKHSPLAGSYALSGAFTGANVTVRVRPIRIME
jgi:hypothetical protein